MNNLIKVLVAAPAVLFIVIGVRWLVAPAGVAPEFGLELGQGIGLSSQIGDMSAFFLTGGICMLLGVISGNRTWYYPPMMLLGLTAIGRIIAWLGHGAAFATTSIAIEVIVVVILLIAVRRLPASE